MNSMNKINGNLMIESNKLKDKIKKEIRKQEVYIENQLNKQLIITNTKRDLKTTDK